FTFANVSLAPGSNSFTVTASDDLGNQSSFTRAFTRVTVIDTTPPALSITAPPDQARLNHNFLVEGQATDAGAGVSSVTVTLDGGAPFNLGFDAGGHFRFLTSFAVDGTADGVHTVLVRAVDAAGNAAALTRTITLDTTAPATPTLDLAAGSDTPPVGDGQTT